MIGINYWPGETAMHWWEKFDSSIVKRDFSLLAEYRFDPVRIFLLWEDFQPEAKRISMNALENLVRVADIAHDLRIQLLPTFFCGHMSGVNWLPAWMIEPGGGDEMFPIFSDGKIRRGKIRNIYSDREVRKAQKLLIHETTGALQAHPAIWGWDLGNKPSNLSIPPSKDFARAWIEEMVTELQRRDSPLPITVGIDQKDLEEGRVPGPKEVAPYCEILSIHARPGYAKWANGPLDEKALLFLCLLTRWLGGKEVLLEGFGVATKPPSYALTGLEREKFGISPLVTEDEAGAFFQKALDLLRRNGIIGALAWGFSDYDPSLWDEPPLDQKIHERFSGLFRWDKTPKIAAKLIQQYPRQIDSKEISWDWVDITSEEYQETPFRHLPRLYRNFQSRFL